MSHESSYSFIIYIIIDIQPVRTYIYPYIYIYLYLYIYIYITSIRSIVSLILLAHCITPSPHWKSLFGRKKTKKWAAGGLYFLFFGLFRDVPKPLSMRFFFWEAVACFIPYYIVHGEIVSACMFVLVCTAQQLLSSPSEHPSYLPHPVGLIWIYLTLAKVWSSSWQKEFLKTRNLHLFGVPNHHTFDIAPKWNTN